MKVDLANPPNLERCDRCGKIAGRFKGYYGAECQCDVPIGSAFAGAHSAGPCRPA
jgi:hypothetical protein